MKRDNKKALYESIMTSVAKEVKKVLLENEGHWWDIEPIAINFDKLPDKYKSGNDIVLFDKMSKEEIENFIKHINWDIIRQQLKNHISIKDKKWTLRDAYVEEFDGIEESIILLNIPYLDNVSLKITVSFDWHFEPYFSGSYDRAPEGGECYSDGFKVLNTTLLYGYNEKTFDVNIIGSGFKTEIDFGKDLNDYVENNLYDVINEVAYELEENAYEYFYDNRY